MKHLKLGLGLLSTSLTSGLTGHIDDYNNGIIGPGHAP